MIQGDTAVATGTLKRKSVSWFGPEQQVPGAAPSEQAADPEIFKLQQSDSEPANSKNDRPWFNRPREPTPKEVVRYVEEQHAEYEELEGKMLALNNQLSNLREWVPEPETHCWFTNPGGRVHRPFCPTDAQPIFMWKYHPGNSTCLH